MPTAQPASPQPKPKQHQHDPEDNPVAAKHIGCRHLTELRPGNQQHAQTDREHPTDAKEPFILDLLAQADGGDNLQDARDHRPDPDHQHDRGPRQIGIEKNDRAGPDPDNPFEQVQPAIAGLAPDRRGDGEQSIDRQVGAGHQHQRGPEDVRARPGENTEPDGDQSAQDRRPPVSRQRYEHMDPLLALRRYSTSAGCTGRPHRERATSHPKGAALWLTARIACCQAHRGPRAPRPRSSRRHPPGSAPRSSTPAQRP